MRQPQRVWKTFYRLKLRANFFLGKSLFEKTTFCTARPLGAKGIKFVAPWTVVRSDEFVNKTIGKLMEGQKEKRARQDEAIAKLHGDCPPYTEAELLNSGKTHYVGDDCPGGHKDLPDCCRDNVAVGYQAGTFPAQKDNVCVGTHNTRFGKESFAEITPTSPNNDNNVIGPTS